MLNRMEKEIKKEHHPAAPAHERAGAAEKYFYFLVFLLDKSYADLI